MSVIEVDEDTTTEGKQLQQQPVPLLQPLSLLQVVVVVEVVGLLVLLFVKPVSFLATTPG